MPDSPRGSGLFGLEGGGWLLDGEEDGAEQVPAALWGRLVGQPVLPEADEITGGVGVFPGHRRGPIARLFSGPRRFDRLCGGRLR